MIAIESKRRKRENILKKYPNAVIADVTSQATDGLVRLSPFYPHGGIPVPFSEGYTAMCVWLNKFYNEGSCATVAAAWKTNDEECRWIAYGDSVVFHYNPPRLVSCKDPLDEEGFRSGVFHIDNAS